MSKKDNDDKKVRYRVKKIYRVKKPARRSRRSDSAMKIVLVIASFFFLAYVGFNIILYLIDAIF